MEENQNNQLENPVQLDNDQQQETEEKDKQEAGEKDKKEAEDKDPNLDQPDTTQQPEDKVQLQIVDHPAEEPAIRLQQYIKNLRPQKESQYDTPLIERKSIKELISQWYQNLEQENGKEEIQQRSIMLCINSLLFVGGIFVLEKLGDFIDGLK